jgi:hypothetical protein
MCVRQDPEGEDGQHEEEHRQDLGSHTPVRNWRETKKGSSTEHGARIEVTGEGEEAIEAGRSRSGKRGGRDRRDMKGRRRTSGTRKRCM